MENRKNAKRAQSARPGAIQFLDSAGEIRVTSIVFAISFCHATIEFVQNKTTTTRGIFADIRVFLSLETTMEDCFSFLASERARNIEACSLLDVLGTEKNIWSDSFAYDIVHRSSNIPRGSSHVRAGFVGERRIGRIIRSQRKEERKGL